ncbi:MAG: AAA family ATPase, partial [Eubacteriales bacterium]|nr:AAA family ATPase [Eubacteriales bacterium]
DPGEGKTTFVLALVALLTQGQPMPEEKSGGEPINVIYQTAEDGLADTIKPRLLASGADCSRVLVIDEADKELTLCDKRLEQGIQETGAKVIILDPLQAYLGGDVDMHRANEVRPVFKRLFAMAGKTGCAVILIGHMNKAQGVKASYRGLGSIDFRAAARSILLVGKSKENPKLRIVAHDKSSLAPEGKSIAFELGDNCNFRWKGFCDTTVDELLSGAGSVQTKTMQMEQVLKDMLEVPVQATEIYQVAADLGIEERTVKIAKKNIGVVSEKTKDGWMCSLPGFEKPKPRLRT